MSTTSWMPLMEPSRGSSTVKYDDVMAEFRANGRDSDTSSLSGSRNTPVTQSCLATPGVQITSPIAANPSPTPCSLCGICPPSAISPNAADFISVKDGGSAAATSLAGSSASVSGAPPVSQFASNMDILDFQNQFGAGLRKLLVDKPGMRPESSWPFLRRDFSQINTPATSNLESIWQLNGSQYARPNNLTTPIGGFNYQLQRLQQLRQKKPPGFIECVFCRNNGEQASFYRSHELKDQLGRVICPVLRAFTCPCCGATGDNAHTIKYCPEKGSEFIPDLSQLKARVANLKGRVNLARRYSGDQELGSWFNQEQQLQ